MVHNWVLLEPEASITDNWYSEGMAEYYGLVLMRRNHLLANGDFISAVNDRLMSCYTNPLVNLTNEEAEKLTWNISNAQELPYGRGFAYAWKVNSLILEASAGKKSIDDLVLFLLDQARSRKSYGVKEYLFFLCMFIGSEAAQQTYDQMTSGALVIPGEAAMASMVPVQLIRKDKERWELGFDEAASLTGKSVVRGLIQGSRADRAGLKDGDR